MVRLGGVRIKGQKLQQLDFLNPCLLCDGKGKGFGGKCSACNGTGDDDYFLSEKVRLVWRTIGTVLDE